MAYDLRILSEYRDVLNRPKFNFDKEYVDIYIEQFEEEGLFASGVSLGFRLPDPDDEPFLEVALSAMAVALITGNKRHFPKKEYGGIKILSPAESLGLFGTSI